MLRLRAVKVEWSAADEPSFPEGLPPGGVIPFMTDGGFRDAPIFAVLEMQVNDHGTLRWVPVPLVTDPNDKQLPLTGMMPDVH